MERLNAGIERTAQRIFQSRVWFYIETVILVGLFALFVESISDYDNAFYQTLKYQKADRFILALLLVIFIVRKVRLLNWQSLVLTLVFIPIAIWQIGEWKDSPDIRNILVYETACEWVALMILADMMLYKKKLNDLSKGNISLLILYALLACFMLFHRNGRNEPLYLVFPLAFFILTDFEEEEWERLIKNLIVGWFVYYLYAVVKAFVVNPYLGGRYYGYYVNIGSWGMFLACSFVIVIISMIYTRKKFGLKSPLFVISCIWLAINLFMSWISNTRTMLAGAFAALLFLFLFARKDISKKAIIKRILLIVGIAVFLIAIYLLIIYFYKGPRAWKLAKQAKKAGIMAPFYVIASRIMSIKEKVDTSSLGSILFSTLDTLSSNRLTIIKAYMEYFNFSGNSIPYIDVNGYYAFTAHNNYIQFIADYGYPTAVIYFGMIISSFVVALKNYLRRGRRYYDLLICLWIVMCLGVWMGEACSLNFPASFVMMLFICRIISEKREIKSGEA